MQDINNYIKETDTDNVILKKLKELGTKLTGQENVQGETVSEVLDFINSNYSGGGSGSNTVLYLKESELESTMYAYKDEECTIKFNLNELYNVFNDGCIIHLGKALYLPTVCMKGINPETGEDRYTSICIISKDTTIKIYSSEYTGEIL